MRELKLIEALKKRAGKIQKGLKLGIGDDAAVIEYTKDEYMLWAQDMLVENTHFKLKEASVEEVGTKAISVNISDIASMGGTPKYILVSIGIPSKLKDKDIEKIFDGIFKACKKHNIKVIGGDTNYSEELILDVSMIGFVKKKNLLTRSGAKVGDVILITGPIRNGKKEHLKFIPRLKEACFLTKGYKINSMIDTSDGLAMDLTRLARASKVGSVVYEGSLPLVRELSTEDALYYGESFELLFTMGIREVKKLFNDIGKRSGNMQGKFYIIGEVVLEKEGNYIVSNEGKRKRLKIEGFKHL